LEGWYKLDRVGLFPKGYFRIFRAILVISAIYSYLGLFWLFSVIWAILAFFSYFGYFGLLWLFSKIWPILAIFGDLGYFGYFL